jgi:hypothetical protein
MAGAAFLQRSRCGEERRALLGFGRLLMLATGAGTGRRRDVDACALDRLGSAFGPGSEKNQCKKKWKVKNERCV